MVSLFPEAETEIIFQEIDVTPYQFSPDKHYLSSIVLEVDFFNKKNTTNDPFNSDDMAKEFSMQFCKQAFTVGMQCVFNFSEKRLLSVIVKVTITFSLLLIQIGPHFWTFLDFTAGFKLLFINLSTSKNVLCKVMFPNAHNAPVEWN